MLVLKVQIDLGNEAMQSRDEIADALHDVTEKFRQDGNCYIPVLDKNGNGVGHLGVYKEDYEFPQA